MKKYHLSYVLSIISGRLISNEGLDGIYDILSYLNGNTVHTHEISDVIEECRLGLLEQHPELTNINLDEINTDNLDQWLKNQINIFGEYLEIKPLNKCKIINLNDKKIDKEINRARKKMLDEEGSIGYHRLISLERTLRQIYDNEVKQD